MGLKSVQPMVKNAFQTALANFSKKLPSPPHHLPRAHAGSIGASGQRAAAAATTCAPSCSLSLHATQWFRGRGNGKGYGHLRVVFFIISTAHTSGWVVGTRKKAENNKGKKRKDVNKKVKIITAKQARREREGERGRRAEAEAGCRVGHFALLSPLPAPLSAVAHG